MRVIADYESSPACVGVSGILRYRSSYFHRGMTAFMGFRSAEGGEKYSVRLRESCFFVLMLAVADL